MILLSLSMEMPVTFNRTKRNWNKTTFTEKTREVTLLIAPKGIEIPL